MFLGMRIYSVHIKPTDKAPYESPEFVPEGYNIFAFIFGFFWLLYYRLWIPALAFLLASVVVSSGIAMLGFNPYLYTVLQVTVSLLLGFEGNDLRRWGLKRRGYLTADVVTGSSLVAAEQRFFDRHISHISPSPAVI